MSGEFRQCQTFFEENVGGNVGGNVGENLKAVGGLLIKVKAKISLSSFCR